MLKNLCEDCHSDPALRERNLALDTKDLRDSSLRCVESHVIPAKAGIHRKWVPAFAGTTTLEAFMRMGGP
jgi:hypothetical protein